MNPLSLGLGVISGLSSLSGLLGGNAEKARAEAARQQAITDMSKQLDDEYQNLVQNNQRNLNVATGQGGTAIRNLGSNLGAAMANAGVYNSSATAGAITQATANQGAQLAGLAANNQYNAQNLLGQNQRYLTGMRLNVANEQLGQANADLAGSRQGLSSFLGTLAQFNLGQSGAQKTQNSLPRNAGGYGNDSVLDLPDTLDPYANTTSSPWTAGQRYNAPSMTAPFSGYDPNSPIASWLQPNGLWKNNRNGADGALFAPFSPLDYLTPTTNKW